jgi:hypothetical protein
MNIGAYVTFVMPDDDRLGGHVACAGCIVIVKDVQATRRCVVRSASLLGGSTCPVLRRVEHICSMPGTLETQSSRVAPLPALS